MLKEKLRFAGVEHKVMASEVLLNQLWDAENRDRKSYR